MSKQVGANEGKFLLHIQTIMFVAAGAFAHAVSGADGDIGIIDVTHAMAAGAHAPRAIAHGADFMGIQFAGAVAGNAQGAVGRQPINREP